MLQSIANKLSWMYWTLPSILFIGGIFASITVIAIIENHKTFIERKGFLPIPTTPGDRLFISVLFLIGVFLLWLAFFQQQLLFIPLLISLICVILIFWKG